jgi:hypothetical protein
MGGNTMTQSIHQVLVEKGIQVPEHHIDLLNNQWKFINKLRDNLDQSPLADYDIGLTHVPGGDRK